MSKHKYKKITLNPWVLAGAAAFMILIIVLTVVLSPSASKKIYNEYVSMESSTSKIIFKDEFKDHVYKKVNTKKLSKMIDNGDEFVLYIGKSTCEHCLPMIGRYNHYFKDQGLKGNIYYLDVRVEDGTIQAFLEEYGIESSTPLLIAYKDGKKVRLLSGQPDKANERTKEFFIDVKDLFE